MSLCGDTFFTRRMHRRRPRCTSATQKKTIEDVWLRRNVRVPTQLAFLLSSGIT